MPYEQREVAGSPITRVRTSGTSSRISLFCVGAVPLDPYRSLPSSSRSGAAALSSEQGQAIAKAYASDTALAALAKQYGVRRSTVSEVLKRAGTERREQGTISKLDVDRAVMFLCAGLVPG